MIRKQLLVFRHAAVRLLEPRRRLVVLGEREGEHGLHARDLVGRQVQAARHIRGRREADDAVCARLRHLLQGGVIRVTGIPCEILGSRARVWDPVRESGIQCHLLP